MDAGTDDAGSSEDRPGYHRAHRDGHEGKASPRACLGILRLARTSGSQRLEAACERGNDIGARNYGSIASILKHGLDKAYAAEKAPEAAPIWHGNIHGGGYDH